jgi:hypothetical protein
MDARRIFGCAAIFIVAICTLSQSASADVADSAASGFTVKITTNIHEPPADVYRRLIRVGDWWSPEHTFSGDAHNLSIEERPMGCFCEKLPNGGAVRHMRVVFLWPGKLLRLSGGLGPLQEMAATGSMSFKLSPAEGGTKLEFTYAVAGYTPQGMNALAPIVNQVLTEQINRFKNYAETGNPAAASTQQKPK